MTTIRLYGRELNVTDEMMNEYSFVKKYALPITEKASKKMLEIYDNYRSLEEAVKYFMRDKEECYKSAAKVYVDILHEDDKKGYDYSAEDFLYEYYTFYENSSLDKVYELIVDSYNKLTHKKISAEFHRDFRKASRSRMYGAGTSITKAFEASAIAGTFNLFTGVAHSIFNAVDGAITNSGIESDMENVYKKCRDLIYDCAFSDVYAMRYIYFLNIEHEPIYIYREKALKIKKAIDNGDVPKHRLAEQVAEVLFLMPENWTLYLWAFNLVGDDNFELTRYAELFEQKEALEDIRKKTAELIVQKRRAEEQRKQAEEKARAKKQRQDKLKQASVSIFGDDSDKMDRRYHDNPFYPSFLDAPNQYLTETAHEMCETAKKLLNSSKYFWSRDNYLFERKLNGEVKDMCDKFKFIPPRSSDVVMMVSCDEYFNTILLTNKEIISVTVSEAPIVYRYDEIRSFEFVRKESTLTYNCYVQINGKHFVSVEFDERVFKLLKDIVDIFKLKNLYRLSRMSVETFTRQLQDTYNGISGTYFNDPANSKSQKKFKAALDTYVKLAAGEEPILLYDATLFGSAKDGLTLTNRGIHSHTPFGDAVFVPYYKMSVSQSNKRITINDIETDTGALSDEDWYKLLLLIKDCRLYFTNPLAPLAKTFSTKSLLKAATQEAVSSTSSTKKTTPKAFVEQLRAEYSFSSHIYYHDFDEKPDKKIQKKFHTALNTYVKLTPSEIPLVLFDSTVFGSAKEGFVLITRGIHINADEQKMEFITYGNLSVSQNKKDLITNGKPISMIPLSTEQVSKVVDLIKRCRLYSLREYSFENLIADAKPTETAKPISSDAKAPTTSRQEAETKKTLASKSAVDDKTDPKAFVRELYIKYTFRSNVYWYDFGESKDKKTQKKFRNALDSYAKLSANEIPIVLFDSTVFGSAKDGFVLTTKGIHIHEYPTDAFIIYNDLKVQQNEKDKTHLTINGTEFSMLYEENVIRLIEVINLCKDKFKTHQQFTFVGVTEYNSYSQQIAGVPIDFKKDFAEIDALLNGNKDIYTIRTKLMFIRRKAENQRAAAALNELASYYKKLGEYIQAEECSELARKFSR